MNAIDAFAHPRVRLAPFEFRPRFTAIASTPSRGPPAHRGREAAAENDWIDEFEWRPSDIEEISSLQNPTVKHCVKLRNNRSYREDCNSVCVVGEDLVHELPPNAEVLTLFYIKGQPTPNTVPGTRVVEVTPVVMSKITGLETVRPTALAVEVVIPPIAKGGLLSPGKGQLKRLLVLDRCQDPGNLGTLLRTALALSWDAVFLLPGCCDPFNEKCIRAGRGACFKLPIQQGNLKEWQQIVRQHNLTPIAAELDRTDYGIDGASSTATSFSAELDLANPEVSLILGSEGQGISPEILQLCTPVSISMPGDMESLNVAAAGSIFMWALSPSAPRLSHSLAQALQQRSTSAKPSG